MIWTCLIGMSKRKTRIKGWTSVKRKWLEKNPPDKNGNYECWLCHNPVPANKVSLDHVASVELYPEYAKELSNLRPTHEFCNQERAYSKLKQLRGRKVLGIKLRRK